MMTGWKGRQVFLIAVLIAGALLLPLFITDRMLSLLNKTAITVITVLGLNILTGWSGQISMGQSAFMAVGAYTSAYLATKLGLPFLPCLVCSGLLAGLIGLIIGLPALRIRGFYLIVATIAAHIIIVEFLCYQLKGVTGGAFGIKVPSPAILTTKLDSEASKYFMIISCTALFTWLSRNLMLTKTGRAFVALKNNEFAAWGAGINVYAYKLIAFFVGCFYAGVAGSLLAYHTNFITPEFFTIDNAIWYLGMMIIGGEGSIAGAIIGTCFLSVLFELVTTELGMLVETSMPFLSRSSSVSLGLILPGGIIILFLLFSPKGLYQVWHNLRRRISQLYVRTRGREVRSKVSR